MGIGRLHLRVLSRYLLEDSGPEIGGEGEHVRLGAHREMGTRSGGGEIERVTDAPLDRETAVHGLLDSHLER